MTIEGTTEPGGADEQPGGADNRAVPLEDRYSSVVNRHSWERGPHGGFINPKTGAEETGDGWLMIYFDSRAGE